MAQLEMTSVTNELRKTVYAALVAEGLGCPVYDDVPDGESFPYVAVGDSTEIPWDSKTFTGSESTITIHVYSQYRGAKEAVDIGKKIVTAMTKTDLSISGYQVVVTRLELFSMGRDLDGETRHLVIRFRWTIEDLP